MSPSMVALAGFSRKLSWKRVKLGRSGTSSMSDLTRALNAARSPSVPRVSCSSRSLAISPSTLRRCATSLRVLLMLVWNSTLLRDVLLSWMLYFDASKPLNWVPSKPAVPQTRVSRVGSRKNSSRWIAFTASAQLWPAFRKLPKPDGRYSAGIISSASSTRKYSEITGWLLTARRMSSASWVARATSSYPSSSICRRGEGLGGRRRLEPRLDIGRSAHRGPRPQERREPGESEPRLVPQEDQIRLDREQFLHHAARVVDVAVEGAVGERDQANAREKTRGLEIEQGLLQGPERDAAIHGVGGHRIGLDVVRLGACHHHAVVMRLVTVAVDDRDVTRRQERLFDHLVGRRRAVGDEEHAVASEGAGRHVLGAVEVAGGLEERVEAAGGCRGFGEEQRRAVELAHVADPVRLEDRFAAGDGQSVERADRTLGVALEVVEVGGLEPLGHALDGAEMDFEGFLDAVEHPADTGRDGGVAGDRVHVAPAEQVDVDLRTDPLQRAG